MLDNFNFFIKNKAINLNFPLCGVVKADKVDNQAIDFMNQWSNSFYHADMDWINKNQELRFDPRLFMENTKTIVMLGYPYSPIADNFSPTNKDSLYVASYAHAIDYHYTLKKKMEDLALEIKKQYGENINIKWFTDSAPFMERYWGFKAGLGWIGRSGMLINRTYGSMFLLACMLIDKSSDKWDISDDFNGCGNCKCCVDICPTKAILENKTIDSRKCISYLTIEHRGDFSDEQISILSSKNVSKRWICGCDQCIGACPYNKKIIDDAIEKNNDKNFENGVILKLSVNELESLSGGEFKRRYGATPLSRPSLKNLLRNAKNI